MKRLILAFAAVCWVGFSFPVLAQTKPAPKAPAKAPAAKAASKAAAPKKSVPTLGERRAQAAKVAGAARERVSKFTSCAAFKDAGLAQWDSSMGVANEVGGLLGKDFTEVDTGRGEFETTAEHEAKVAARLAEYVGDPQRFVFSILLGPSDVRYNADKGEAYVTVPTESGYLGRLIDYFYRERELPSQAGVTRMGVRFRYKVFATYQIDVDVGGGNKKPELELALAVPVTLPMDKAQAVTAQNTLAFVMLGELVAPPSQAEDESTPSLDDPRAIASITDTWIVAPKCAFLYDRASSRIIHDFAGS